MCHCQKAIEAMENTKKYCRKCKMVTVFFALQLKRKVCEQQVKGYE